jgi:large subunit ribosomal protein L54
MLVPKVPIYEQTVDLPAGDGSLQGAVEAANARGELTKALRNKRRANIKEANFLKAMG